MPMHRAILKRAGRTWLRDHHYLWPHERVRSQLSSRSLLYTGKYVQNYSSYVDSTKLDLHQLDLKWQKIWNKSSTSETAETSISKEKKYILPMFPYPSGNLHLGHFRNYTIPDVLARFWRMKGQDVLLPMGWDAFGLPAENAAIERGIDPAVWTKENIRKMKVQLRMMNGSWDWSRELATCDPEYYKHTQLIFLLLHEQGLAYQAESMVNYDPVDKTVLANEQVDANGNSWRSGAKVEKRMLKQWFLKISNFREALLEDLEILAQDGKWPQKVLTMQRNWLGRSKGARIKFQITSQKGSSPAAVEVFTTRPDTLFGVQYIALASNHCIVEDLSKTCPELRIFLDSMSSLPHDSKAGFMLPNTEALNPLSVDPSSPDATKAPLPVYVAPYVLGDYGDGAVMGVPGHDARDFAFWKENQPGVPVRNVIQSEVGEDAKIATEAFVHQGVLNSNNGKFVGRTSGEAAEEIVTLLKEHGSQAEFSETWRLRDWLVSRQRYWGTPIPIVHCASCGAVPVPSDELPVKLPSVEGHWLRGKAGNPLEEAHDWLNTVCPKCHGPAERDTDTMDTFVDSSWYFMRFADPYNENLPFSSEAANKMLSVDMYIGGVEHAILHLLYARFVSKFLAASTDLWPAGKTSEVRGEPFKQLLTQGMVHGKTCTEPSTGRFLKPEEVDLTVASKPMIIATGEIANVSFEKMSKSKYNGVDPSTCIVKHGADATRAHMLFQAPPSEVLEWDEDKITGVTRWLRRLYDRVASNEGILARLEPLDSKTYFTQRSKSLGAISMSQEKAWDQQVKLWLAVQRTILSVTESLSKTNSLNTVVSDLMTLTNTILDSDSQATKDIEPHALSALIRMMAPITPAFSEECWEILQSPSPSTSIFKESFPLSDDTLALLSNVGRNQKCAVQINGKLKFVAEIPKVPESMGAEEVKKWIVEMLLNSEEGKTKLTGLTDITKAKKVIVVKGGKTVNFVV